MTHTTPPPADADAGAVPQWVHPRSLTALPTSDCTASTPHHVSLRRLKAFRPNHSLASISMTSNCSLYRKIHHILPSVQLWDLLVVSNMNKWFIDLECLLWIWLTAVIKVFLNVFSTSALVIQYGLVSLSQSWSWSCFNHIASHHVNHA